MNYFWIFIYFVFAGLVLAFFFWSIIILQRQKKSWSDFAKKHDLIYRKPVRFMDSGSVEGNYKNYRLALFSEGRIDNTRRGMVRYRTVLELIFGEPMAATGALGNSAALPVIEALKFGGTYHPDTGKWNKHHVVTCADQKFIREYLTPRRLERLNNFFNMNNVTNMFIFDTQESFLRIETADPMADIQKLERLLTKLIQLAEDLKLSDEEKKKWLPETAGDPVPGSEPQREEGGSPA